MNTEDQIQVALNIIDDTETVVFEVLDEMGVLKSDHYQEFDWSVNGLDTRLIHEYQGGRDIEFYIHLNVSDLASHDTIRSAITKKLEAQKESERIANENSEAKKKAARQREYERLHIEFGNLG